MPDGERNTAHERDEEQEYPSAEKGPVVFATSRKSPAVIIAPKGDEHHQKDTE